MSNFPRFDRRRSRPIRLACLTALVLVTATTAGAAAQVQDLLSRARSYERAGDYNQAERAYRQALEIAPSDLEILKRLGVIEQTELKLNDSIIHFHRVLESDPQYPEVSFFLGVSYFGLNDFSRAIEALEAELKTPRPHPRCRYYLALALQSAGRTEEAISQLNRAVADNPKDADALYQLARNYKNASLAAAERLKTLDPDSFQLHALMGEVYAEEERYVEAIEEYQAALRKRPEAAGLHYSIGIAYWAQNQLDAARRNFLEALKENPDEPLTNLYLGDIAVREHHFNEGMGYLRIAVAGQPRMEEVHLLLGKCYRGLSNPDKAKSELLAAASIAPNDAQPHYLLAQVYRELNDPQASAGELAQFEKLSKADKESRVHEARPGGEN